MIPRAEGVALGVEEGHHAAALIVVEQAPDNGRGNRGGYSGGGEFPPAHAGGEQHRARAEHEHDGGAEVRLPEHESGRQGDQRERRQKRYGAPHVFRVDAVEIAASARTRAIFIGSEGWRRNTWRSIQRCAPMPVAPAISTAITSASDSA